MATVQKESRQKDRYTLIVCCYNNMGKPGVVTTPGGKVDAAGGGTDGGGTVPGTVDDRAGGNVVPITGGIVVTVYRKTHGS